MKIEGKIRKKGRKQARKEGRKEGREEGKEGGRKEGRKKENTEGGRMEGTTTKQDLSSCMVRPFKMVVLLLSAHLLLNQSLLHSHYYPINHRA